MLKINNKKVAVTTEVCEGLFSKLIGLMFSRKIKDRAVIFIFKKEQIVPLHMFFVFYPIDVLFVDKKRKIVEVKRNLKPFRFYTPKRTAKYVIELPTGYNFELGDKVSF